MNLERSPELVDALKPFTSPRGVIMQAFTDAAADRFVLLAKSDPRHCVAIGIPGEYVRRTDLRYAARAAWIHMLNRLDDGFPSVPAGQFPDVEMLDVCDLADCIREGAPRDLHGATLIAMSKAS